MKSINYLLLLIVLFLNSCKTTEVEVPKSSAKEITSIELSGITGSSSSFDKPTNTYTFTVPVGTYIKAIPFSITIPTGATANPKSGSVLDFTNPVSCTITAEDGTSVKYMIIVLVQKSSQKQILSFSFDELNPAIKAAINQTAFEITAELPTTANLKSLKPTITFSDKASVSPTSGSLQDFTNPVKYTITADDGSKQEYLVKIILKSSLSSLNVVLCFNGGGLWVLDANTGKIINNIKTKFHTQSKNYFNIGGPLYYKNIVVGFDDDKLKAVNINNSQILWSTKIKNYSGNIYSGHSPTAPILKDETIYLSVPGNDKVLAIDINNGKILWESTAKNQQENGGITCGNGILYCPSLDEIIALDLKTGNKLWSKRINGLINNNPSFTDNYLVLSSAHSLFYQLNLKTLQVGVIKVGFNGLNAGDYEMRYLGGELLNTSSCSMSQSNGIVFYQDHNTLYAQENSTGNLKWTYNYQGLYPPNYNPLLRYEFDPFIFKGVVFSVFGDGAASNSSSPIFNKLFALNSITGKVIWETAKFTENIISSPVAMGNAVYIFTDKSIYSYDINSGKILWVNNTIVPYSMSLVDDKGNSILNATSGMTN